MNPSGLTGWSLMAGLAALANIAQAQTSDQAQTPTAQNTLNDQVRQQVLRPGPAPGAAMPANSMGADVSPGMTGTSPGVTQGSMRLPMEGLFGSRVTPMMSLSVEDVRYYLTSQLERLKNKRLKLGDVTAEDGSITADIVTVENSLVQRLKVDRHTGLIKYEN